MDSGLFGVVVAIGGIQGLVLAVFLLARGGANGRANRVLAFLIISVAIDMVFVYLNLSGVAARTGLFLFLTDPLYPLFGPLLLLFVLILTEDDYVPPRRFLFLLVPAALELVLLISTLWMSREARLSMAQEIVDGGDFGRLYYVIWIVELTFNIAVAFAAVRVVSRYRLRLKTAASETRTLALPLLRAVLIAAIAFLVLQTVAAILAYFGTDSSEVVFFLLYLLIGLCFYLLGYWASSQPEVFHPERYVRSRTRRPKYEKSALDDQEIAAYAKKLEEAMGSEKLYLKNDLRIADVAEAVGTSTNHISQVINARFDQNFYDFVNSYRVAEAMRKLRDPKHRHLTLLAIALAAGFNSKSTFNKVFKEQAGMTPSEYQRNGPSV